MLTLHLTNVRSFCEPTNIPLTPITFLVGENSSGKTTAMATLAAALRGKNFPVSPDFNEPPYSLGSFHTISTYKGGRFGRAKSFTVGLSWTEHNRDHRIFAEYDDSYGQPRLLSLESFDEIGMLTLKRHDSQMRGQMKRKKTDGSEEAWELHFESPRFNDVSRGQVNDTLQTSVSRAIIQSGKSIPSGSVYRELISLARPPGLFADPVSIAPIRTRPERTYDRPSEVFDPEGNHIPYVLARAFDGEMSITARQSLLGAIRSFGDESGLFSAVKVQRLGRQTGAPFKLMVLIAGRPRELLDVGYGVSQSLPIVVQFLLAKQRKLILLQQPEVHLHPRSQAALGTLIATLRATERKYFVVETHSDFLIDRVRHEVKKGTIPADDVSIVYFERNKHETIVHSIRVDKDGNTIGVPGSYRRFFLREAESLLF